MEIPVVFYVSLFIFLPFFICTLCCLSYFELLFELPLWYFQLFWPQCPPPLHICLLFVYTICFQSRQHSLQYTLDKSTGQWRNDNPRHWQHCVHKTKNMISCEITVVLLISVHVEESYNRIIKTAKQSNRVFKKQTKKDKKQKQKQTNTKSEKKPVIISWPDYATRTLRIIFSLPD